MGLKKGIVHFLPLIVIGALVIGVWFLVFKFVLKKNPFSKQSKEPTVALQTSYENPFDKKTQYVNPFEENKNPFAVAK